MMTKRVRRWGSQAGYTMLETLLTVGVMSVVTGMAVVQLGEARPVLKADGAMRVLMGQLNTARELAISQRRNMRLNFINGNQVQLVREEFPGPATTVLSTISFEGGVTYTLVTGVPDTPDAFGNATAVAFGAAATYRFSPDGMFIDQLGNPLNGTVYMAIGTQKRSARAVTIFGATGRVRAYRYDARQWKLV